jgi:oligoribonuclease NrnB/cAMP/cGMP phosphodiesterase (DHH superfamily)
VDVQVIAAEFGGGGHTLAAGIRTEMPAKELEEKLVGAVKKQLAVLDNAKSGSQTLATMPEPQLAEATLSI